jgi:spermidine/putrescine transport system permease protein
MKDRSLFKTAVIALVSLWIVALVCLPNLLVVAASFLERDEYRFVRPALTLDNYRQVFDPVFFAIFMRSFGFAAATTALALAAGYPFATLLARSCFRRTLLVLVVIPFWTSSLVRTYALIGLLKAKGIVNSLLLATGLIREPLSLLYTDGAVLLGLVYTLLPFMILPLYAAIEKLDPQLIEAGYDLGASRWQVLWHVTLPVTLPGIVAGSILVFLPALGIFYVPDLLGGAKSMLLGNLIKNQFLTARHWPFGSAVSVFLTLLMGLLLWGYYASLKRFNPDLAGTPR